MKSRRAKLGAAGLVVLACAIVAAVLLSGSSATPAAEGTWLAWEEWRGGETKTPYLLAVNLDDADAGPATFSDKGWAEPALSEELLLWVNGEGDNGDASLIYRRALPAGEPSPVDQRDEHQHTPAADGQWVVWLEDSDAKVKGGAQSIDRLVAYNLARGERRVLVEPVIDVEALSISGERIVWIEVRVDGIDVYYDVHAYDLDANEESILHTYADMPIPGGACVSGSWALWYLDDYDTDTWRVVAYDFTNGKLRILPKDATSAVDDGWVVCNRGSDVSVLSLVSGERRHVVSDAADFSYAQVHLPWVTWLELDLGEDSTGSVIRAVNVDTGEQRRFETPENQAEGIGLTITKD